MIIHGRATRRSPLRSKNDSFRSGRFFVQLHFIWDEEHNLIIRKIYDHRMAGRQLQQMLKDVGERRDHLTSWFRPEIKKALYVHWETDEGFKYRRLTNRANRASVRLSKYTDGSTTFIKIKASLDASGSTASVVDTDVVWRETALAPYKNHVIWAGVVLRQQPLHLHATSATSQAVDFKEGVDLKLQELTRSLHE
ncbi:hypothetical protein Ahy_A04g018210 [Arachis hypogaea]|uniref:Uncharacterized protein n=1 Tax=Arachis hypogaea TaxID=3818 RepID=A0A445DD51_ARAHY|nr:hypothetical protein Ahy_A04g018210 [Arachis hypogaea]